MNNCPFCEDSGCVICYEAKIKDLESQLSTAKAEADKYRFMIDEGLGWEDMEGYKDV